MDKKTFEFPAWCERGKGDSSESFVEVELTEEEAERLVKYGTREDVFYDGFLQCDQLKDIYKKVYRVAVAQMTEEIREFDDSLDEKYRNDPKWRADYLYSCGVDFPKEFEDAIADEEDEDGEGEASGKGIVRIILGCVLIALQIMSYVGNAKAGNAPTFQGGSAAQVVFSIVSACGYFLPGLIGVVLLFAGIHANRKHRR